MTIFTIRHDRTGLRQVTHDPGTNWAPHPTPDGRTLVFASGRGAAPGARTLTTYLMDVSSLGLGPASGPTAAGASLTR